uniref:DUF7595 domain-containing protein n=1 Tax=Setaria viridis TaxID=4556 RepID=A0A4U6SPG7_SETVI|nr:hypothetical protein SEVIR_9G021200v2 [Setaria viridis]
MPPRKRRRTRAPRRGTATASPAPELPANLLAEIAARSDAATIFRCAATCKLLRREILSPDFIRRVTGGPDAAVPSYFWAETSFSLVHPTMVAGLTLASHHLAPFVSRAAAGLLEEYTPLTSRGRLVVLRRSEINTRPWSQRRSDLCVYDPMTDSRAFFPDPPDIGKSPYHRLFGGGSVSIIDYSDIITAADGIGCSSFILLSADMDRSLGGSTRIRVQTLSPDAAAGGGKWGPLKSAEHQCPWWCMHLDSYSDAGVVIGGVVHWLMHAGASFTFEVREYILTYDVSTDTAGSVDLPVHRQVPNLWASGSQSQLASSPDGKLSLIVTDKLVVSIWVLSGSSWARQTVVDMEATWRGEHGLELVSFGDQRSGAVFVRFSGMQDGLYGIEVETKTEFFQFFQGKTGSHLGYPP